MVLQADIVHKDTLFIHEQLFCVIQDLFLFLIDADIDHKDTSFPNEQLFRVL